MTGTLYGLGVGPGAPDLLTLRAVNVLRTVDVILAAASPRNDYSAALDTARPHLRADARLLRLEFPMTRDAGILRAAWLKAAEAARDVLEGGENAAFLTIGDPLVYSTFGYLLRTLREVAPHLPVAVVPGITSFQAAAARTGTVLCEGGEKLRILPGINGRDDLAVQRIINVPKRGIGAVSIGKVNMYAAEHGMNFYDALLRIGAVPGLGKAAPKIDQFTDEIGRFRKNLKDGMAIQNVITDILESTGYKAELMEEGEVEAETRLENISELSNKAVAYWEDAEEPTLDGFLEEVALVADIDSMDESEDRVVLMTLHSAKGLEFPYVYMSGLEDGLFPSSMAMSEDPEALEEERRLCYVGITRAEKTLMMTGARQRMVKGETRFSRPSRFLAEIPEEYKEEERQEDSVYQRSRRLSSDDLEDPGLPWARSSGISMFGQNPYVSKKSGMPSAQPAFGKAFTVQKAASLDYAEGDRVHHVKFGDGTVKQIADGGKDYEVTVEFDSMGVRKMFASFARLQKL